MRIKFTREQLAKDYPVEPVDLITMLRLSAMGKWRLYYYLAKSA